MGCWALTYTSLMFKVKYEMNLMYLTLETVSFIQLKVPKAGEGPR